MTAEYNIERLSRTSSYEISLVTTTTVKSYIVMETQRADMPFNWFYIGTRKVRFGTRKRDAISYACRLAKERRTKHNLAASVRTSEAMRKIAIRYIKSNLIRKCFHTRSWGVGALIIVPENEYISDVLADESHPCFTHIAKDWVCSIRSFAKQAREQGCHVKLTPDFDGNKPKIRELFRQNLSGYSAGILSCGKSSYTTTGLMACADAAGLSKVDKKERVVVVGCGNLGKGVLQKLKRREYSNLAACDFKDNVLNRKLKSGNNIEFIHATNGAVAKAAFKGAKFVFITLRNTHALSNTNTKCFRGVSTIIVGSNQAISTDKKGNDFVQCLRDMGVNVVLGPIATLGGPITATVEAEIRRNAETIGSNQHLTKKAKNMIHQITKEASMIITKAYLRHVNSGEHPKDVVKGIMDGSIIL